MWSSPGAEKLPTSCFWTSRTMNQNFIIAAKYGPRQMVSMTTNRCLYQSGFSRETEAGTQKTNTMIRRC
jgi:hypothetical protein